MANVAAIRIERQRLAAVEAAEEHYRIELEQAASIQRLCLPEKSPSIRGYQLEGTSVPCFSVGGDYFDYFQLPDGRWMVVIGDVAGKGTPAALLVMSTQAHANALARTITDLGDFVTQLNLAILPRCPGDRFISLFACIVDPGSEEVVFCNAGHNPPVLLRADGSTQQLRAGGPVLGIVPVPKYPTSKVTLAPGDQLVLYTDGITEAHSPEDKEFETGNLEKFLREKSTLEPKELLGAILKRVEEWTHGAPPSDDRTLVMVRRS
jgi:sigma-B regulation protein RsbU (phosphoserine phosphatase)